MALAHEGQAEALEYFITATAPVERLERLTAGEAAALCPIVRPERLIGAVIGRDTADIEVHELHQGYLRLLKRRGGSISTSAEVTELTRDGSGWRIVTPVGTMWAATLVNAAGAWAAQVGALAGALNVGLRPLKRTACLVPAPEGFAIDSWPMVVNVAEEFYLKPDAGMLLLSPADETESAPCDAQADELDIAIAIARVEQATTLNVRRVVRRWAGLRSFVADSSPVIGYDPIAPSFFWVAALGGYGIQTAPAIGRIAARLAARREVDADILEYGIELAEIAPGRGYRVPSAGHQIGVARS
jgi:D-arginine dehydrogenase